MKAEVLTSQKNDEVLSTPLVSKVDEEQLPEINI